MHIFFEHKIFMVTMMFWTQSFENSTTNILEPWIQNPHQPANHVILGKILSNRNIQILYHQIGYLTDYSFQPQFFCLYILCCKCVDLFFYMIMICPGISWTIRGMIYICFYGVIDIVITTANLESGFAQLHSVFRSENASRTIRCESQWKQKSLEMPWSCLNC